MKLHLIISAALALLFAVPVVSADYPTVELDFDSADLEIISWDNRNSRWNCYGRSRSRCNNSSRCSWSSSRRFCRPSSSGGGGNGGSSCSRRLRNKCTGRCQWRNGRCRSRMSNWRPSCSTSSRSRCNNTRGCRWLFRNNHRNGGVCRSRNFDDNSSEEYDLE